MRTHHSLPNGGASQKRFALLSSTTDFRRIGPVVALVAVVAVFSVAAPSFLSPRNLTALFSQTTLLLTAAVGETFVILLGCIDLSTEGVMAMSSMVTALLVANNQNGLDLGLAGVLIAVACGALLGFINGALHTWIRIPSFMATLGTWFVGTGIATALFAGKTPVIHSAVLLDLNARVLGIPLIAIIGVSCAALGAIVLGWTRFGRAVYAIGGSERIATLTGLPVRRYKILAFTFAGAMNATAGVLATIQIGDGSVTVGQGMLFSSIAAVVVGGTLLSGGRGGIGNTVIGSLLLTCIASGMIMVGITPNIQQSVQGMIVIAAVASSGWALRRRLRVVK